MVTSIFSDSLSFGMREAIENDCADEVVICCACKFANAAELEEIISRYLAVYWGKCPEAADLTRKAYKEGRILVPKAEGFHAPIGSSGQPLYSSWTEWQFEVAEHAPDWRMGWCPSHCEVTKEQVLAATTPQELYQLFPKREW